MKVLVVDDTSALRLIVSNDLRRLAAISEVAEADSAEAAIELLRVEPVDLIVCDWEMKAMSGLELLQALRGAGWSVPLGFVSTERYEAVAEAAFDAGAAFVVTKPFESEELAAAVQAAFKGLRLDPPEPEADRAEQADAVRDVLERLLRREVEVAPAKAGPTRQVPRCTARYVDARAQPVGLYVLDTLLACALSAALLRMPPPLAEEWARSNTLSDLLTETFEEIMRMLARTVACSDQRCVLDEVLAYAPGEQLHDIDRVRAASAHDALSVSLDRYGGGLLCLTRFEESR